MLLKCFLSPKAVETLSPNVRWVHLTRNAFQMHLCKPISNAFTTKRSVGVCGWQEYEISRHRWRQHVRRTAQVVASVCCRCYSPPLWPSSKESSDTVSQSSDTLSQSRSRRRTRSDECPCAIALFSRVAYGDEARAAGAGPVLVWRSASLVESKRDLVESKAKFGRLFLSPRWFSWKTLAPASAIRQRQRRNRTKFASEANQNFDLQK